MAKAKKPPFPKTLYVTHEGTPGEDGSYLNANDTPVGAEDGQVVAVYQLVETKTMKVTRALE